jgi:restriction system protein
VEIRAERGGTTPKVWCVRANGGQYAEHFLRGGYVGIGWRAIAQNLSEVRAKDRIYDLVKEAYPDKKSPIVIGNFAGQIARFLLEIRPGDYVITPAADSERLNYGVVGGDPSYFFATGDDGCPYRHRRRVAWAKEKLKRASLSVPFQNTLRSMLTVFAVTQSDEFLAAIGLIEPPPKPQYDPYRVVLEQVLELDSGEFEILVGQLLTALGFEGSEVVGRPGDGGVDATGELNVSNLAKVRIFVQAKRYKLGSKVTASTVKQLRQSIPSDGQGAFITTADFQEAAQEIAVEDRFPRIGLINGRQLVDLLVEHWDDIPPDFRELLGLKPGLVRR